MKNVIYPFIALLLSITVFAQPVITSKPKLVVGIVIDQMRYDYIYRYWNKYSNDGFKKLVDEGFFCKNTNYNYVPTYTAPGHAAIYTGATPALNGIIGNNWFDKRTGLYVYCAEDSSVVGVGASGSEGKRSPKNMLVTTITDELRIASNMKSKVIGIALKDRGAILPTGHTANAAYWYDKNSGNFISSTYYMKELPKWVNDFNQQQLPKKYLSQEWNTLLPIDQYIESLPDDNNYETILKGEKKPVFPHNLPVLMKTNEELGLLPLTPFGNSFTKNFAIQTIKSEGMGKTEVTDFLAISFSSPDYIGHAYGPNSIEQEDNFIRLDKDIAELLSFIEQQVGKNNALIFLTADHAAPEVPAYLQDLKIPAGYVNTTKIIDSLKQHLLKMYGDKLVLSFSNQQIFLDHKMIATQKLDLKQVQDEVALFLQNIPEISEAITATTMNNYQFTEGIKSFMQRGFNTKRSGDVLINYLPGYIEHAPVGTTHGSPYSYDTHVPLIFYGWNIKAGSTAEAVSITDIAPTLSILLNLQFPNACSGKPILGVTK
ncbi:MAG: alkaline phosphatase PafA [Bacteroidia bacterium]